MARRFVECPCGGKRLDQIQVAIGAARKPLAVLGFTGGANHCAASLLRKKLGLRLLPHQSAAQSQCGFPRLSVYLPLNPRVSRNKLDIRRAISVGPGPRDLYTQGNLSSHLAKLETAGYVALEKKFKSKHPLTTCRLTKNGRAAVADYTEKLKRVPIETESSKSDKD